MILSSLERPGIVLVEVQNPEVPFGGVVIDQPGEPLILVEFDANGGNGEAPVPPPVEIPDLPLTTNLLAGDGSGWADDSGIAPGDVVQKNLAYPTPTTLNEVIACLKAAGLCAP